MIGLCLFVLIPKGFKRLAGGRAKRYHRIVRSIVNARPHRGRSCDESATPLGSKWFVCTLPGGALCDPRLMAEIPPGYMQRIPKQINVYVPRMDDHFMGSAAIRSGKIRFVIGTHYRFSHSSSDISLEMEFNCMSMESSQWMISSSLEENSEGT